MFNLTAYVDNGIVIVKTLNDFYATSNVYDITPHIKVDTNSVNVALPFKQIEFGYEDTKTLLALKHSQQFKLIMADSEIDLTASRFAKDEVSVAADCFVK